jgi:hypothetical protein
MVTFKVGDKVRLKRNHKKTLGNRYKKSVGTITDFQMSSSMQQYCRVQFSDSTYDYDDLNSRHLELIN